MRFDGYAGITIYFDGRCLACGQTKERCHGGTTCSSMVQEWSFTDSTPEPIVLRMEAATTALGARGPSNRHERRAAAARARRRR